VKVAKTILKLLASVVMMIITGEVVLFAFGFPSSNQLRERDVRMSDDELIYRLRPNARVTGMRTPYFVHPEIRTNSLGLRDKEIEIPKPPGTIRILSLGIHTHSAGVCPLTAAMRRVWSGS
jgi:hypothetical protein